MNKDKNELNGYSVVFRKMKNGVEGDKVVLLFLHEDDKEFWGKNELIAISISKLEEK